MGRDHEKYQQPGETISWGHLRQAVQASQVVVHLMIRMMQVADDIPSGYANIAIENGHRFIMDFFIVSMVIFQFANCCIVYQ